MACLKNRVISVYVTYILRIFERKRKEDFQKIFGSSINNSWQSICSRWVGGEISDLFLLCATRLALYRLWRIIVPRHLILDYLEGIMDSFMKNIGKSCFVIITTTARISEQHMVILELYWWGNYGTVSALFKIS